MSESREAGMRQAMPSLAHLVYGESALLEIDLRSLSEVLDRVCGAADIVMAEDIVEGLGYTDFFHRLGLYPLEVVEE